MEKLRLTCLGSVQMSFRGQDVALGNRKARALLVVLAAARGASQRREALATMLWERSAQKQALNSLNQTLYVLRRELTDRGFAGLRADMESIELAADAVEADFLEFDDPVEAKDAKTLKAAITRYRGPFMQGFTTSAPAFEHWLATERARLADIATDTGMRLMALAESTPDMNVLVEAEALLKIDPYNESALRVQMRHLAKSGRLGRALSAFDEFKNRLDVELGVVPSAEIQAFRDAIGRGEISAALATTEIKRADGTLPQRLGLEPAQFALSLMAIAMIGAVLFWLWDSGGRQPTDPAGARLLLLPLTKEDGQDVDHAFAGLMEDLSVELSRAPQLELISRETARARSKWATADARELGATHVLRASVRLDEDVTVLILRLIETQDDILVWSHHLAADTDLLAFRERILNDITHGLQVELSTNHADTAQFTDDPEAFEHYLTGISAYYQTTPEMHRFAIEQLQTALERDPDFALARSALARAHFRTAFGAQEFADAMELHWIEGFLAMKLAITDPSLEREPGALVLRSQLALHRRDLDGAIQTASAAVAIAPGDYRTRLMLARVLIFAGDHESALKEASIALALNPMRPASSYYLNAMANFGAGDIALAAEWIDRASDLADPVQPELLALAAATKALMQDREAADQYLKHFAQSVQSRPRRLWRLVPKPSGNARALTWDRPLLASVVAHFPFQDAATIKRLARGLVEAGIGGHTLGYYLTTENERLREADIRKLMFDARTEGASPFGDGSVWRQERTKDGLMFQNGLMGPAPLAREAESFIWKDQLCDRWMYQGSNIELCATLYKLPKDSVLPGEYLLANDITFFAFSALNE